MAHADSRGTSPRHCCKQAITPNTAARCNRDVFARHKRCFRLSAEMKRGFVALALFLLVVAVTVIALRSLGIDFHWVGWK